MGSTAQHCRLGTFQDSDFAGDLEDSVWVIQLNNADGVLFQESGFVGDLEDTKSTSGRNSDVFSKVKHLFP